ncbi:MAG: DJ-1 family glyoxalase III [Nitrospiria bacterium]
MKKALVLLAPGFEEIETVTVVDILRRAGIEVTLAGTADGPLTGRSQIQMLPDVSIDAVLGRHFDVVVLPGGQPGTRNLGSDPRVKQILAEASAGESYVAAICAAPSILSACGYLKDKKATSHPSVRPELSDADYSEDAVAVDGRWVTSRAPGTAMAFAFKLVELLSGSKKADEVNQGVMARL